MQVLRTSDDRFVNLPEFPFAPHYLSVPSASGPELRVHYLDEGPRNGHPIVLLHGQPSWCYLYRNVIPVLAAAGFRVVAPDLIGFGRSDKPTAFEDYSYLNHVNWMRAWLAALNPGTVTLVAHDWGGFIGLRMLAAEPERYSRVLVSNTGLLDLQHISPLPSFFQWREYVRKTEDLAVGAVIQSGSVTRLSPAVMAAYDAPFPDVSYKAAVRAFPELVPVTETDPATQANREAWAVLERWQKPFLTVFGDKDPMNVGSDTVFQKFVPGAKSQPHRMLAGAGHYLQEDVALEFAKLTIDLVTRTQ